MMIAQRRPHLSFTKVWEDDDIAELMIRADDGANSCSVNVYASHDEIKGTYGKLETFKGQVHGGILDITFGSFGPEYAHGAFHGRFHFANNPAVRVLISLQMQSDFFDFGEKNIASETSLYLMTEPGLLDDFVRGFSHLDEEVGKERQLECVEFNRP